MLLFIDVIYKIDNTCIKRRLSPNRAVGSIIAMCSPIKRLLSI